MLNCREPKRWSWQDDYCGKPCRKPVSRRQAGSAARFRSQGNASSGVGSPKATLSPSGRQPGKGQGLLSAGANNLALTPFLQATRIDNLRLLPASSEYSRLELIQEVQERALPSFRDRLREAGKGCDYILIDCPPSLGGLPTIALSVSDAVLIPVQCEYYAMEGLSQILPLVNKLKQRQIRRWRWKVYC
jgi:chromosome partitioning protein